METSNVPRPVRALRRLWDNKKSRELEGAEAGFTLIELMVVLLIMAILLAIAIPTFLGVKGSAQDRAAQSDLTNALTSAKAGFANSQSYGTTATLEVSALSSAEPNLTFVTGSVSQAAGNSVSVITSSDGLQLVMITFSASTTGGANGTCWGIADQEGVATANLVTGGPTATTIPTGDSVSEGVYYAHYAASTSGTCSAAAIPAGTGWTAHF